MSKTITLEIVYNDCEYSVTGSFVPSSPGKYYGPWEDSYPEEPPEFEIMEVSPEDEEMLAWTDGDYELVVQECLQKIAEMERDPDVPEYDDFDDYGWG